MYLGPGYHEFIEEAVRSKVEGSVVENVGLVIAVGGHQVMDKGKLQEGTGLVLVPVKYRAVFVQLFKNEVIDAVVSEVNKLGFFADIGTIKVFVSKSSMP